MAKSTLPSSVTIDQVQHRKDTTLVGYLLHSQNESEKGALVDLV
jgi:hypothetical protein